VDIESRRAPVPGEKPGQRPDVSQLLVEKMAELTPKLGQPAWTSDVDDLAHVWS